MIVIVGASSGLMNSTIEHFTNFDSVTATYFNNNIDFKRDNLNVLHLDLMDAESINQFVHFVKCIADKRVTIMFASVFNSNQLYVKNSAEDIFKSFEINLLAPMRIVKEILPILMYKNWGRIIFFSSVVSSNNPVGTTLYSTTKRALEGFSSSVAVEYGRFNITSNVLQLGYFNKGLIEQFSSHEKNRVIQVNPMRKLGDPVEIFEAVKYIISSGYLNGQILRISGGI